MIAYPLRILIVEDNPHQAFSIENALRNHIDQIEIQTAVNGEECIRRLSEEEYSAVMLDYDLPGLNGVELIERIRNQGWQFPLIMVTGEGDEEIAVRAMKAGANEYVSKSKGYLLKLPRILENAIERSNLEIQLREAEERYRKLAENANDLIFTMDNSLSINFVTSRIRHFLGYSPEEAVGKNLADFLSPENPANLLHETLRPGRLGSGKHLIEMEWVTKDGELRNVELSLARIVSRNKVVAYQGIARDCTQRVALEKQIMRKNRELTAVVSVSSAISHTLDVEEISRASLSRLCDLAELTCGAIQIATFDETVSRVISSHNFSARFILQLGEKSLLQDLFKGLEEFKRPWTNLETEETLPFLSFRKVAALCAEEGVRSHLILPLLFNNELMGFLLGGGAISGKISRRTKWRFSTQSASRSAWRWSMPGSLTLFVTQRKNGRPRLTQCPSLSTCWILKAKSCGLTRPWPGV